ncbi:MAG: M15 family metallopeptidase [Desulfovibrionaceae bacterium]
MYTLSKTSMLRLSTVCEELQRVVYRAFSYQLLDITIAEGIRTIERQKELLLQGFTKTLYSKHLQGEAVDIYPYIKGEGMIVQADHSSWESVATIMKRAAQEENIKIQWGGDWKHFIDKPHWEMIR